MPLLFWKLAYCIARNINLVVGPQIMYRHWKSIKFGGSVRDHHAYICKHEILVDFNLAVAKVDYQIFQLYSIYSSSPYLQSSLTHHTLQL